MARRRPMPAAVMTIAILHLVGGGLGLLGSLCMGFNVAALLAIQGGGFAPPGPGQPDPMAGPRHLVNTVPGYVAVEVVRAGVGFIFDVVLIVAGIGLLNRQAWARYLSIGYAGSSILVKFAFLAFQPALVVPAMLPRAEEKAAARYPNPMQRRSFALGVVSVDPCITVSLTLYPIAVLAVMMTPSVARFFSDAVREQVRDEEDDYPRHRFDEDEDRARGRPRDEGEDDRGRFRPRDRWDEDR